MKKVFDMFINKISVVSGNDDIPCDGSLKTHRGKMIIYRVEIPTKNGVDVDSDIWYPGIFDGVRIKDVHIFDGDRVAFHPGNPSVRTRLRVYRY